MKMWSELHNDKLHMLTAIRREWADLMAADHSERDYHQFIARNSSMCWGLNTYFTISKLSLGGKYEPDFVLIDENGSYGMRYTLVEIEKPQMRVATGSNDPACGLTHAMKQIRDWKHWIARNPREAAELFPSKFSHDNMLHLDYMVIIGSRKASDLDAETERLRVADEAGYPIRSFDYITDNLNRYVARNIMIPNSDTNPEDVASGLFEQLANPFFQSIENTRWRDFIKLPSLTRTHMIGRNAKEILKLLTPNDRYAEFLEE